MQSITTPDDVEETLLHRIRLEQIVAQEFAYPKGRFGGRGIVIPAGGSKYFPCAWVCIKMLRYLGCTLPIEVWHLGPAEMNDRMKDFLRPLDVTTVDALSLDAGQETRILRGWELKAFALLHCPFEEAMLIDADNVPIVDPAFLFDTPEYQRLGAIFWPDYGRHSPGHPIWDITGVAYRDEPEFESGQIVVDKSRCWKALNVAMHLNEYSDFYYRHVLGDKETFHLAWRKLEQEYAMPPFPIHPLRGTMCQHDFEGRRIFQHRNLQKWRTNDSNARIAGFLFESECLEFLREIGNKNHWLAPGVSSWCPDSKSAGELELAVELIATRYEYHRVGHDRRLMTFSPDGSIAEGAAGCERDWDLTEREGAAWLNIYSASERTMSLRRDEDRIWRGEWEVYERMPVELTPISDSPASIPL